MAYAFKLYHEICEIRSYNSDEKVGQFYIIPEYIR